MAGLAIKTLGGTGEDLVLIHGFGADRLSWIGISPELMTRFRVHALDLPGHGESAAVAPGDGSVAQLSDAVRGALAEHGVGEMHVLGHSLGGAIAMQMVEDAPQHVLSLALIAPVGLGHGPDPQFLSALAEVTSPAGAEALLKQLVAKPQLINRMTVQRLLDHLGHEGVRAALSLIGRSLAAAQEELAALAFRIGQSGVPRSVFWGSADRINPVDEAAVRAFGGSFWLMEGAGHLPHVEAARQVNAALSSFHAGERG